MDQVTIRMTEDGHYIVPKEFFDELMAFAEQTEPMSTASESEGTEAGTVAALAGSRHTYCCVMGPQDQEKQQFRSYSWQAPLFCIRIARSKGYSQGRVSRGECGG